MFVVPIVCKCIFLFSKLYPKSVLQFISVSIYYMDMLKELDTHTLHLFYFVAAGAYINSLIRAAFAHSSPYGAAVADISCPLLQL